MIRRLLFLGGSAIALFSILAGNPAARATKEVSPPSKSHPSKSDLSKKDELKAAPSPTLLQNRLPIQDGLTVTEMRLWEGAPLASWQAGRLTVPDREVSLTPKTAVNAVGKVAEKSAESPADQVLRPYDRHVARLFELTHAQCQQSSRLEGMRWMYEVANGNVSVGEFRIRCQTAREIVSGYRLGAPQILSLVQEGRSAIDRKTVELPALQIVGSKVKHWRRFVGTIHPMRLPMHHDPRDSMSLLAHQIQQTGTPKISVVIPTALPKIPLVKATDRFVVQPTPEGGYRICPTHSVALDAGSQDAISKEVQCDRTRVRAFQQIVAVPGGEFYAEQKVAPRDLYRKIELAGGVAGLYLENCGEMSCQAAVQWKRQGVLYEVQAQYRDQPILVAIANHMIQAAAD